MLDVFASRKSILEVVGINHYGYSKGKSTLHNMLSIVILLSPTWQGLTVGFNVITNVKRSS